jgi:hypothetical protein
MRKSVSSLAAPITTYVTCDMVTTKFYNCDRYEFGCSVAAGSLFWPTSDRKGIDIILFTASALHLSAVTL